MTDDVYKEVPAWCIFRKRRCRVLYYRAHGFFVVLYKGEKYDVHRTKLTFLKGEKI